MFMCLFFPCRWIHIMNADDSLAPLDSYSVGLYQCTRCKTISIGSPRNALPKANDAPDLPGARQIPSHLCSREDGIQFPRIRRN